MRFFKQKGGTARIWTSLIGENGQYEQTNKSGKLTSMSNTEFITNNATRKKKIGKTVTMEKETKLQLKWWLKREPSLKGIPLTPFNPAHALYTNTGLWGWGASLGRMEMRRPWTVTESMMHSNNREMKAVIKVVNSFQNQLRNSSLLILSNNPSTVAAINKQGRTTS